MAKNYIVPMKYRKYRCDRCGNVTQQQTNHFGKIYNMRCEKCSWKNPMESFVTMTCIEKKPKNVGLPPEWKSVRLGDIAEIHEIKVKK